MQTNWRRLTREELYDLVWSKPTVQLAKEFLVSDVAIAKRCKSLGIPKPSLGYWRKIETGERPKRIPLPKPGQKLPTPTIQRRKSTRKKPEPFAGVPLEKRILVSDQLEKPHALVRETKRIRERKGSPSPDTSSMHWSNGSPIDLRVSLEALDRALRIADAFIKAILKQGYTVDGNHIVVNGERIRWWFKEKTTQHKRELTAAERAKPSYFQPSLNVYTPTGQLFVFLEGSYTRSWHDRMDDPLEYHLHEVLDDLVAQQRAIVQRREEQRLAEIRRREEDIRRYEITRRQQEEQKRFERLEGHAKTWRQSRDLRAFIMACEEELVKTSTPDPNGEHWLVWARNWADRLDPFLNGGFDEMRHAHLRDG